MKTRRFDPLVLSLLLALALSPLPFLFKPLPSQAATTVVVNSYRFGLNPESISGLQMWLKADAITGLSDGDAITTWEDSSAANHDGTGSGGARPTYQTNELAAKPVVRFDGSDDQFTHTVGDHANYTVFAVVRSSAAAAGFLGIVSCGTSGGGMMMLLSAGTAPWGTYSNAGYPSGTTLDDNVPRILCMVDAGASGGTFRTNGAADGTWVADSAGQSAIQIGGITGQSSAMDVAEILIYDNALSAGDITAVEVYLAAKWGVTLAATGDHQRFQRHASRDRVRSPLARSPLATSFASRPLAALFARP